MGHLILWNKTAKHVRMITLLGRVFLFIYLMVIYRQIYMVAIINCGKSIPSRRIVMCKKNCMIWKISTKTH